MHGHEPKKGGISRTCRNGHNSEKGGIDLRTGPVKKRILL